jgi:predicted small secreted protein
MRKSIAFIVLIIAAASLLAGCNTMRGVGKDVEAAGRTIQKSADKND